MDQNYTLGRGKVYFARFKEGTRIPEAFLYIGNTPEFNLTIETENLDHFSSDEGVREKDASVPLETTRTGSLVTDSIQPRNVALFFFGTEGVKAQAAATGIEETFESVKRGASLKLGITPTTPSGVRGINEATIAVALTGGSTTALVKDVDFKIIGATGRLEILETSTVVNDTGTQDIEVTYDVTASNRSFVISGSKPVEGAMMYEANNPEGANYDYYLPYVKITPNGDIALKGEEWQQIPLNLEILKNSPQEAIYLDGRPYAA